MEGDSSEDDDDYNPGAEVAKGSSSYESKKLQDELQLEEDLGKKSRAAIVVDPLQQLKSNAKKAKINAIWEQLRGEKEKTNPMVKVSGKSSVGSQKKATAAVPSFLLNLGLAKPSKTNSVATAVTSTEKEESPKAATTAAPVEGSPEASGGPKEGAPDEGDHKPTSSSAIPEASEASGSSLSAAAAAALAAARSAGSGSGAHTEGKIKVTEVKFFAGESVEVTKMVDRQSRDAQNAMKRKAEMQASATSGLDAMLAQIEKKKKMSILEKSRKDWGEYKEEKGVQEELEEYKKSGDTFTEKLAFLSRAELREYEKERDERLAAQARKRV